MSQLRDRLAEINRSHRWIVAADVAAAATETVGTLRGDGAGEIFVVSATEGVGELPSAVPVFYTRTSGETIMGAMRAYLASIAEPSPRLLAAVDDFDPVGNALAITPPFHTASSAAGRAVYGGRRPEWAKLEDKTVVAPIWDAAGIARAPSAVVSLADAAAAAAALGGPLGTVWVADNTEGWHGGGDYTRWIRNPGDVTAALDWFEDRAVRVRVMPFLDGIPCSIHGYVASDGIAAFRPVEMVVLRRRATSRSSSTAGPAPSGIPPPWCATRCAAPRDRSPRSSPTPWATAGLFPSTVCARRRGSSPPSSTPASAPG